ncbi:hypothetical protein GWK47_023689 [Chionoecetes opilio]|uniref:Uncharacterized protein n=1 Tax=Chionoecetes opilio TaxID=41210 RepID=A0A8J5CGA4_CHIOP|nr:hypothetical protein GWK47_023689 [Chionoecetes opilio]
MDGKRGNYLQDHPLPRGGFRSPSTRKGKLSGSDVFRHNSWEPGVSPTAAPAPGNGPRPLKAPAAHRDKEIGRASGGEGPGTWYVSEEPRPPLFARRRFGRGERGHRSAMQHGWGEEPASRADVPSTRGAASWVVCDDNSVGPLTPLGARARFPQRRRPSGREGHSPGFVGAPVT